MRALSPQLRRVFAWAAALTFAVAALVLYADDVVDAFHAPVEGDFHNQLLASRLVFSGHAAKLYHASDAEVQQGLQDYGTILIGKDQYPPASALIFGPFTLLPEWDALVLWRVLMAGAMLVLFLGLAWSFTSNAWRVVASAVCLTWSPLLLNVRLGQLSIVLAALFLVAGWLYLASDR